MFVGSTVRADGSHERASGLLRLIAQRDPFTTDHILVETFGLLRTRSSHAQARLFWLSFLQAPIRLEVVGAADLERARSIAEAWPDQRFSIVDCTSFAVMERLGCSAAATFDHDFAIYRYGLGRKKAFEIVR